MQLSGYGLPRIPLLRTLVNKGTKSASELSSFWASGMVGR